MLDRPDFILRGPAGLSVSRLPDDGIPVHDASLMPWPQPLDPLGNPWLSTGVAAIPVVLLLGLVASGRMKVGFAALLALAAALGVALLAFRMPVPAAFGSAAYGAAYGLFPIGWIVLNVMFLHALTVRSGLFQALKDQLLRWAPEIGRAHV